MWDSLPMAKATKNAAAVALGRLGGLRGGKARAAGMTAAEWSYGENMLNLTLAKGYVRKLLDNARVVRFLNGNYGDILAEFERLAAAEGV